MKSDINSLKKEILKLQLELKTYKKLALIDPLTELYNRRKLKRDIERYSHLKDRYKIDFLLVMIDVDGLKQKNDKEGHKSGDIMLKRVANTLKNNIRKFDKSYRIGGDEFVLLLSHSKKEDKHILERIRAELSKHNIKISVGCSKLCEDVLEIADKRMYIEKNNKKEK